MILLIDQRSGKQTRGKVLKLHNSTASTASGEARRERSRNYHIKIYWSGDTSEIDPIEAETLSRLDRGSSTHLRTEISIRTGCPYSSEHESAWRGWSKIR